MELVWTDDLSIGNAMIDADHKMLLDMVNGVVHAIEIGDCSVLSYAFDLLDGKLRTHCAQEENIAQAINFTFTRHKLAEQYILRELNYLKDELLDRNCVCCEDAIKHYSDSLRGLLIGHITEDDRLMKPVLQSYPYNFNPVGS